AHSMGGGIAARYIERYQHDFQAAVLVTPMLRPQGNLFGMDLTPLVDWGNWVIPRWFRGGYGVGRGPYAPDGFADNDLTHSKPRYARLHDRYTEEMTSTEKRPTRNPTIGGVTHGWLRQAFDGSAVIRRSAGRVRIPVLIFQASEDTAVRGPEQVEFCRAINETQTGPCTGYRIDHAFHAALMEADTFRMPMLAVALDYLKAHRRS